MLIIVQLYQLIISVNTSLRFLTSILNGRDKTKSTSLKHMMIFQFSVFSSSTSTVVITDRLIAAASDKYGPLNDYGAATAAVLLRKPAGLSSRRRERCRDYVTTAANKRTKNHPHTHSRSQRTKPMPKPALQITSRPSCTTFQILAKRPKHEYLLYAKY